MLQPIIVARQGRGAVSKPNGRFEAFARERVDDGWPGDHNALPAPATTFVADATRSIVLRNASR